MSRVLSAMAASLVVLWTSTPLADAGSQDASVAAPMVGEWSTGLAVACPTDAVLAGAGNRPVKLPAGCALTEPGYWRAIPAEGELAGVAASLKAEVDMLRADNISLRQKLLLGADALHDCGSYIDLARIQCPPCECHTWTAAGAACAACAGLSAGATAVMMSN